MCTALQRAQSSLASVSAASMRSHTLALTLKATLQLTLGPEGDADAESGTETFTPTQISTLALALEPALTLTSPTCPRTQSEAGSARLAIASACSPRSRMLKRRLYSRSSSSSLTSSNVMLPQPRELLMRSMATVPSRAMPARS